ncbi:MAG TPA: cytochrome c oxidase subunit II [Burkholderiales bacterium]|nr:cytochrome c oxidase subunit II [Burkholderiales bacterium]
MGALSVLAIPAWAESKYNLQPPNSPIAAQIYDLHTLVMIICTIIFVGVFGMMFYSVVKHRKSAGHQAAHFHENTTVEIIWTIVPLLILVGMAYPAAKTVLAMKDTTEPDLTIKATGYQWKWGYEYLNGEGAGIKFMSVLATPRDQIEGRAPKGVHYLQEVDNPVVVPAGKKVRILTTANDVIHSWTVPAFAVKQDAIPGFIRDAWFRADQPGVYRGQCVELCGKDHGFMPIVVEVKDQAGYTKWVAEQKQKLAAAAADSGKTFTLDELKAMGEKVYTTNCVACHQATGKGLPPTFPPLDGSKVVNGPKAEQINVVLNGRQGTAMQAFGKQLSDADIASVITFTRNSWSNKTGEAIQPSDIKALRK